MCQWWGRGGELGYTVMIQQLGAEIGCSQVPGQPGLCS